MSASPAERADKWAGTWVDVAAFVGGLAVAWFAGWATTDLVWSLWLSSFVVGYALIVWNLSAGLREFAGNACRDRSPGMGWPKLAVGALFGGEFLFGLAFFTVHFGGFHYVHSVFLQYFFPLPVSAAVARGFPGVELYGEVVRRYWIFVPLAFMAERSAFRTVEKAAEDTAVTPAAIERRKANAMNAPMMAPYKNVIRLHLLIFFFFAAHFLGWDNFVVYAVVSAVYFFPWRVWRKESTPQARS